MVLPETNKVTNVTHACRENGRSYLSHSHSFPSTICFHKGMRKKFKGGLTQEETENQL